MSRVRVPLLLLVCLLAIAGGATARQQPPKAPVRFAAVAEPVPGSFIVTLRDVDSSQVRSVADTIAREYRGTIGHVYTHALRGFSIHTTEAAALQIAADSRVALVEQDGVVRAIATQTSPPWGLDRIDQRNLPLSASYTYNATGTGVKAYIIDTGIRFTHSQFGGRATSGYDAVDGGSADDCNGHGTHVSGTVGGSTYGVAKSVSLIGVRVLNCGGSGTNSGVIAGVDWVTGNHAAGQPAVANMSLGGGANSSLDTAVNNSISDGVSYAIAAGNGDIFGNPQNACNYSPARVAAAITVSATNSSDTKA
ncbi:MAG: S8 family peptidase, partial [Actinomycetota bacterium]